MKVTNTIEYIRLWPFDLIDGEIYHTGNKSYYCRDEFIAALEKIEQAYSIGYILFGYDLSETVSAPKIQLDKCFSLHKDIGHVAEYFE